ncbi:hypothetical protein [Streptomyces sp. NBC_01565]|uniref:hypothetical protein n=1 Tax=unclassified Streptomyces TaxID=2593676 RepID=UPI00224CB73A|nr:hypothetical protein [Streptomyces sp. NBC_01565]MCX4545833.1 hypothetical protein [Streptomyces sp. NBC_01565]
MNKAYGVLGSALTGAATGYLAMRIWQAADAADTRSCADNPSLCLTFYPLAGVLSWTVLAVLVFVVALRLLGVRPRGATVPACFALQAYGLALLGPLGTGVPRPSVLTLAAMALGPALVAVCTEPRWRRGGGVAIGVCVVAAGVAYGFADGPFS